MAGFDIKEKIEHNVKKAVADFQERDDITTKIRRTGSRICICERSALRHVLGERALQAPEGDLPGPGRQ